MLSQDSTNSAKHTLFARLHRVTLNHSNRLKDCLALYWIKLNYERNTYVIDLDRITAFCYMPNARVSFALLDGNTTIVVNQQSDPEAYQTILDYVEKRTGFSLP